MGDRERADHFFHEATATEPWSGTWFNWALAKDQWGELEEAVRLVAKARSLEEDPAYLAFQASLAGKLGNKAEHDELMALALKRFGSVETLNEFELFWLRFAASISGDKTLASRAELELARRRKGGDHKGPDEGAPPDIKASLVKVRI